MCDQCPDPDGEQAPKEWDRNKCKCKDTDDPSKILSLVIQAIKHLHSGQGATWDEIRLYIQNMHIIRMDCDKFDSVFSEALKMGIDMGYLILNQCNGKYYVVRAAESTCGHQSFHDDKDPLPCPRLFSPKPIPKRCPQRSPLKCPPKAPGLFAPPCNQCPPKYPPKNCPVPRAPCRPQCSCPPPCPPQKSPKKCTRPKCPPCPPPCPPTKSPKKSNPKCSCPQLNPPAKSPKKCPRPKSPPCPPPCPPTKSPKKCPKPKCP